MEEFGIATLQADPHVERIAHQKHEYHQLVLAGSPFKGACRRANATDELDAPLYTKAWSGALHSDCCPRTLPMLLQ